MIIGEEKLKELFAELERDAYNAEYHNYYYKEANQIIRKHFEQLLPPAEGAEVTLPTDKDIAIEIVARFTANPHPNQRANYEREKKAFANGAIYVRELTQRFLPLHAQRLADKMVEERLREELIAYDRWTSSQKWGVRELLSPETTVNEYLKTRDSHETI